jgi:hypothetical protein
VKDIFQPKVPIMMATSLFHHVRILGFNKPQEELIRAAVSRVPPELLENCAKIVADPTMGAKHGRFLPKTRTILMNPKQFDLRQRFGRGPGWIWHFEVTMVHEVGHSVWEMLTQEQKQQWRDISGWRRIGNTVPTGMVRYIEKRPGWPIGKAEPWAHKPGVGFTRHYGERNPGEDFADCFSFYLMGKPHQMAPEKREFMNGLIQGMVHRYPQPAIEGPDKAYGERELKV